MNTLLSGSPIASASDEREALHADVLRLLELQQSLRARLLNLNFHAFARCMSDLLKLVGYDEVELAGRTNWKGRNKEGGYDLVALTPDRFSALVAVGATAPKPRRTVIVQLKQYGPDLLVHQRCVDELRGACLRTGASEALLITTSGFSYVAQEQAATLAREKVPLAPVQLVDGPALLRALVAHRIGVTEDPAGNLVLDATYFDTLVQTCPGNARRRKSPKAEQAGGGGTDRTNCQGTAADPESNVTLVLQLPLTFTYVCTSLPVTNSSANRGKRKGA